MPAFAQRSYRIADGRAVVCDTVVTGDAIEVLRAALAWRRSELARGDLDSADAVLELRALMAVDDLLGATAERGPECLLTVTRPQALVLCDVAGSYVTTRDVDGYQAPEERGRIGALRALAGPLMDCCCDLAAAEGEARELLLPA